MCIQTYHYLQRDAPESKRGKGNLWKSQLHPDDREQERKDLANLQVRTISLLRLCFFRTTAILISNIIMGHKGLMIDILLQGRVDYLKNPRHVPPTAQGGARSLIKSQKRKAKEVDVKPKSERAEYVC